MRNTMKETIVKRKIKIENLFLDQQNPRLPRSFDSEVLIIEHMINTEQVLNILEDIAGIGLSPIEDIAVCKESVGYTVLEGNRRVSALKLLKNPELLPVYSKKINDILNKYNTKVEEVECVIFNKREDASLWLERKHSGQQNGIGTKPWSAEQKTRFKGSKSNNNTLAINIIDFAKKNEIEEAEVDGILTTVTRFLANPAFRNSIGVKSNTKDSDVIIDIPEDCFTSVLETFISDVVDKSNKNVSSRANKDDVINYGNYLYDTHLKDIERVDGYILSSADTNISIEDESFNLKEDQKTNSQLLIENKNLGEDAENNNKIEPTESEEKLDITAKTRNKVLKNPEDRKYIFTNSFSFNSSNQVLTSIYHELRKMEVNDFPLSCALVTRSLMEYIAKAFVKKVNGNLPNDNKFDNILNSIEQYFKKHNNLLSQSEAAALKCLINLRTDKSLALSPAFLGMNAHAGAYPKPRELKINWVNIESIMQYMLDNIE